MRKYFKSTSQFLQTKFFYTIAWEGKFFNNPKKQLKVKLNFT